MPRDELLARMSHRELREWQAFSNIHPIGPRAEEFRTARIMACIMNAMTKKQGGGAWEPRDFMLDMGKESDDRVITSLKDLNSGA